MAKLRASCTLVAVVLLSACGGSKTTVRDAPTGKLDGASTGGKCTLDKAAKPLVVEWPGTERALLESRRREGPIPVKLSGCQLAIVRGCKVKGSYRYSAVTPQTERVNIHNSDELYANIPVYGASLEAQLKSAGALNVSMQIVGVYEAESWHVTRGDLEGRCDDATHVVAAMTTGAFELFTGVNEAAVAKASFAGAAAGGGTANKHEVLNRGGEEKSCGASNLKDQEPPNNCASILRIETVPIGAVRSAVPNCAEGTRWDGTKCAIARSQAEVKSIAADRRRFGADSTNAGRADVERSRQSSDEELQRALLASAYVHYQNAASAWEAVLLDDPEASDRYEKKFWAADARVWMVRLDRIVKKPVPPEALQLARRRLQDVIDDKTDDRYTEPAQRMLGELNK